MSAAQSPGVAIKGTRDGVSISILTDDWSQALAELGERLHATGSFFAGSRVTVALGEHVLSVEQLAELEALLARYDMGLYSVLADAAETREVARQSGMRTAAEDPPVAESQTVLPPESRSTDAILVRRTVRSGQIVQYPGHVVVIGDVNLDGEIVAAGDVVIWGKLRGVVHAGAMGDDGAIVCALQMQPMQLRIGNHIARAPEDQGRQPRSPEIAFVRDGGIVAERWNNDGGLGI